MSPIWWIFGTVFQCIIFCGPGFKPEMEFIRLNTKRKYHGNSSSRKYSSSTPWSLGVCEHPNTWQTPQEQTSVKFESKHKTLNSWKWILKMPYADKFNNTCYDHVLWDKLRKTNYESWWQSWFGNLVVKACGLMTTCGAKELGQDWSRWWLVAWRHQANTWTNVDLSLVRFSDIHRRTISQEIPQPSNAEINMKITYLKFH